MCGILVLKTSCTVYVMFCLLFYRSRVVGVVFAGTGSHLPTQYLLGDYLFSKMS